MKMRKKIPVHHPRHPQGYREKRHGSESHRGRHNYFEFRFREADFSSFPKGLMYGIDVFDSWLYDENKPFAYLAAACDLR